MNANLEKKCEDFARGFANAIKEGKETTKLILDFEAKLIKGASKHRKIISEKDAIIKEQMEALAAQRLETLLHRAMLREMRETLDQFNLKTEGWDRYVFDRDEVSFFNLLPPKFTLEEFHTIGASEQGLSESSREGLMMFYQRFYLITEKYDGSYSKMTDKVPENLNEIKYIKDRVSLIVD